MKNIYFFLLALCAFTCMSFAFNSANEVSKIKATGIQRPGQIPNCTPTTMLQACASSIVSLANFQAQRRMKSDGEFEFNIYLNRAGQAVLEFNKAAVAAYVNPQRGAINYYKITEDVEISDSNLLMDMQYNQPVLVLPKGDYELKSKFLKYTVTIPLGTMN